MNEQTVKLDGWTAYARPPENDDMKFHRQLLVEVIFGLYNQKKEKLKTMGFPSQPISLLEIWLEFQSRRAMLDSIKQWPWKWHEKRWIDRRVNEVACPKYAENGTVKIVSPKAMFYEPNPELFKVVP